MPNTLYDEIYHLTHAREAFAIATGVRVEKPISAKPGGARKTPSCAKRKKQFVRRIRVSCIERRVK